MRGGVGVVPLWSLMSPSWGLPRLPCRSPSALAVSLYSPHPPHPACASRACERCTVNLLCDSFLSPTWDFWQWHFRGDPRACARSVATCVTRWLSFPTWDICQNSGLGPWSWRIPELVEKLATRPMSLPCPCCFEAVAGILRPRFWLILVVSGDLGFPGFGLLGRWRGFWARCPVLSLPLFWGWLLGSLALAFVACARGGGSPFVITLAVLRGLSRTTTVRSSLVVWRRVS